MGSFFNMKNSMINIASLYYFTLLQRTSIKYKNGLSRVLENISLYLHEEWLELQKSKDTLWKYEVISYNITSVGSIRLFHKKTREKKYYYYPSFFCDINIKNNLLKSKNDRKRVIFLLSNIFECFDEFDEKNLLIEFHSDIEETYNNEKEYFLRYDFININSLWEIYRKKDIWREIKKFIEKNRSISNMSSIKNKFPDVYRTLLFFIYNIFAMEKSLISNKNQLSQIEKYQISWKENIHISLSSQRLKLNKASLEKTLTLYKRNFETFINIMMYK